MWNIIITSAVLSGFAVFMFTLGRLTARPNDDTKLARIRKVIQSQDTEASLMNWPDGDEASNANAYDRIRNIVAIGEVSKETGEAANSLQSPPNADHCPEDWSGEHSWVLRWRDETSKQEQRCTNCGKWRDPLA